MFAYGRKTQDKCKTCLTAVYSLQYAIILQEHVHAVCQKIPFIQEFHHVRVAPLHSQQAFLAPKHRNALIKQFGDHPKKNYVPEGVSSRFSSSTNFATGWNDDALATEVVEHMEGHS